MGNVTLCACGCGVPAPIASRTDSRFGHVKGRPLKFIIGHSRIRPFDDLWVEQDRGYETSCKIWIGHITTKGYGSIMRDGVRQTAHVFAWERSGKTIPIGMQLDHLCRHRACVNVDHLEPVTGAVNTRRGLNTKLTYEDVEQIKSLLGSGMSKAAIGRRFGVSRTSIYHIAEGKTWK